MSESADKTSPRTNVSGRHPARLVWNVTLRTLTKAWDDSIFSKAATAAFWQTLSLPPLLLGVLGSLGFVAGWFGPNTIEIIESKIITFSHTLFSDSVVDGIIQPTVQDILGQGSGEIVSAGFVLSLWAGSSAISTFVDSIVEAHGQADARHPIWQRIFALLLYMGFLIVAVFVLPLVALGPELVQRIMPDAWLEVASELIDFFYYPAVGLLLIAGLTTLYKVALHRSLPWHRLLGGALVAGVFFMIASAVLRRYLSWVTSTGYTYGALATPIAFLLFTFFLGFAVVLGAEFNATIQEFWPARATRIDQMREWIAAQATMDDTGAVSAVARRFATGPIKKVGDRGRGANGPRQDVPTQQALDEQGFEHRAPKDVADPAGENPTEKIVRRPPARTGSDQSARTGSDQSSADPAADDDRPSSSSPGSPATPGARHSPFFNPS